MAFIQGNADHPSVNEVYQEVQKQYPHISKATIYNNIKTLATAGLLKEILIHQDKTLLDCTVYPHHHFKCHRCKRVIDVEENLLSSIAAGNLTGGHQVDSLQITMEGICKDCQNDKQEQTVLKSV